MGPPLSFRASYRVPKNVKIISHHIWKVLTIQTFGFISRGDPFFGLLGLNSSGAHQNWPGDLKISGSRDLANLNPTKSKKLKSVNSGLTYRLKKGLNLAKKSIFHVFLPINRHKFDLETQKFQNVKKLWFWDPTTPKKLILINRGRIYGQKQGLKITKNLIDWYSIFNPYFWP